MTVASTLARVSFAGNGSTTVFPTGFRVLDAAHLVVSRVDAGVTSPLTLGTDYTVSGAGGVGTATVVLTSALPSGVGLLIVRRVPVVQPTDIRNQGAFYPSVHEDALDRLTMIDQQQDLDIARGLRLRDADTDGAGAYDANGNRVTNLGAPALGTDAVSLAYLQGYVGAVNPGAASGAALVTAEGSVTARTLAARFGAVLDVRDFGAIGDGVADDAPAITAALAVAATRVAPVLVLPRGTYRLASPVAWLVPGLTVQGAGVRTTVVVCDYAGVGVTLDAFASGSPSDPFVVCNLLDLTVRGRATTTTIVLAQGLHRSTWRLDVAEADPVSGIGIELRGCMSNHLTLSCSRDVAAMTSVPYEGLRLSAGTRAGVSVGNSSNNTLLNLQMDGLGIGVRLAGADQNVCVGGASQSHSIYGVLVAGGSRYNTFIGLGGESPGSVADIADAGESLRLVNCYSAKAVILQGRHAMIDGGFFERVQIDAGATGSMARNIRLNNWRTGAGGFFDGGTGTAWANLYGGTVTASFATNVMTVIAATQGRLAVGQEVVADGVASGTTITALGTGTGGAGTYTLSTTPGTLAARSVQVLTYVQPFVARAAVAVGASPFLYRNTTGRPVEAVLQGGTVTQVRTLRDGDAWLRSPAVPGAHLLAPDDVLEVSYSVAPGLSIAPVAS